MMKNKQYKNSYLFIFSVKKLFFILFIYLFNYQFYNIPYQVCISSISNPYITSLSYLRCINICAFSINKKLTQFNNIFLAYKVVYIYSIITVINYWA